MTKRIALAVLAAALLHGAPAAGQVESGYAPVNGLEMYYEVHGEGEPLVLIHGALMRIEDLGPLLEGLARTRRVIAMEQQAHGRTADIDRPFSYAQMADDTAALLDHLGIERADIVGYSMGGAITLHIATRRPDLVNRMVIAGMTFSADGAHPGVLDNVRTIQPEHFEGTGWEEAYAAVAPDPAGWARLIARVREQEDLFQGPPAEDLAAIGAPAMVIVGDADVVRPEHAVELFRLLGGGTPGDMGIELPDVRLAILPGTTHISLLHRHEWLVPMIAEFLDRPRTGAP